MAEKFSKKREAIYACLASTKSHPSADWICQELRSEYPDLSLATVYRNLASLKKAGRIRSVGIVDGKERFDADLHSHSHFLCSKCGAVMDVELLLPPEVSAQVEAAANCTVTGTAVRFIGICSRCREAQT